LAACVTRSLFAQTPITNARQRSTAISIGQFFEDFAFALFGDQGLARGSVRAVPTIPR
jgi:hypothetical protein